MTIEELAEELRRRVEDEGLMYGEAVLAMQAEGLWPDNVDQNDVFALIREQDADADADRRLDVDDDGNTEEFERQGSATASAGGDLQDDDPSNDLGAQQVLDAMGFDPELIEYFGGRQPTAAELEKALEAYNALSATPLDSVQELVTIWRMAQTSEAVDPLALLVFESIAPERTEDYVYISIGNSKASSLPGRRVQVRGVHYRTLGENFGLDSVSRNQQLIYGRQDVPASAMVGALAVAGALGPASLPGKADSVSKQYVADQVTIEAYGLWTRAGNQRFIRQPEDPTSVDHEYAEKIREELGRDADYQAFVQEVQGNSDYMEAVTRTAEERGSGGRKDRTRAAAVRATTEYQSAYRQYRNHGLALVALRDPKLAREIYDSGRIPSDRLVDVEQVFLDAGYNGQQWASQGDAFDGHMWDALIGAASGSASAMANGGIGVQREVRIVNTPDDATLQESMRNLWRAWFRTEPTAEEMSGFVGAIDGLFTAEEQRLQAAANGATQQYNPFQEAAPSELPPLFLQSRNIDPESELLQRARKSEQYRRMFGKKPTFMSEDQYVDRFESTARNFAGSTVAGTDAIGAGMESGDTNTTVGQLFMDQQTFDNSSTFRDRLFRAAQAIRDML